MFYNNGSLFRCRVIQIIGWWVCESVLVLCFLGGNVFF